MTTKIELTQANTRLAADNHALRVQLDVALLDVAVWKGKAEGTVREVKLPAHMQRAKDLAIKAGITVRVGS